MVESLAVAAMAKVFPTDLAVLPFRFITEDEDLMAVTITSALVAAVFHRTGHVLVNLHAASAPAVHLDPGLLAHC